LQKHKHRLPAFFLLVLSFVPVPLRSDPLRVIVKF
jgi:hypothetical protein